MTKPDKVTLQAPPGDDVRYNLHCILHDGQQWILGGDAAWLVRAEWVRLPFHSLAGEWHRRGYGGDAQRFRQTLVSLLLRPRPPVLLERTPWLHDDTDGNWGIVIYRHTRGYVGFRRDYIDVFRALDVWADPAAPRDPPQVRDGDALIAVVMPMLLAPEITDELPSLMAAAQPPGEGA